MVLTEPNNKGLVWVFILRLPDDADVGFSVNEVVTKRRGIHKHIVAGVSPGGPAARAGIREKDEVRAYTFEVLSKKRMLWNPQALGELNARGPNILVGVQVCQRNKLAGIHGKRARVIGKLRV